MLVKRADPGGPGAYFYQQTLGFRFFAPVIRSTFALRAIFQTVPYERPKRRASATIPVPEIHKRAIVARSWSVTASAPLANGAPLNTACRFKKGPSRVHETTIQVGFCG